jgi:hypothetical protein
MLGICLNSEWGVEKTISLVGVKFLKYEGKMLTMFLLTHLIKLVVNTQLVHTIITQTLIKPGDFK